MHTKISLIFIHEQEDNIVYDKSGCYENIHSLNQQNDNCTCIMLMHMKKSNQWCFKNDQCHWSHIMKMTNDFSVLLFGGKWTVVWRKKKYTHSQHNMQKNNIKITCQSLAHWVESPKQASEIQV